MLSLRGIEKSFRIRAGSVEALRDVDLDVAAGGMTAVLGESGCGKTTLLRVVAGFERPERGQVELAGRTLVGGTVFVRPERRGIGIVPQDGALFPHVDVAGNVGFGMRSARAGAGLGRARRRARAERVGELLELVGLAGYQRRRPDELSGGQQQRVALARALAPNPAVVLLDEPFSALDAGLRADLGMEVRDLLRRLETTAVLVTHDQSEALSLADTVAVMRAGRVVQVGPPSQVYDRPADATTARFVGEAVILDGRVTERGPDTATVDCALGRVAASAAQPPPVGAACAVVIRPENLALDQDGHPGPGGDHGDAVPARVETTGYFGHQVLVTVRLGRDGSGTRMRVRTTGTHRAEPGTPAFVRLTGLAHLLPCG